MTIRARVMMTSIRPGRPLRKTGSSPGPDRSGHVHRAPGIEADGGSSPVISAGGGAVNHYLADGAFQGVLGADSPALYLRVGFSDGLQGAGHAVGVPAA